MTKDSRTGKYVLSAVLILALLAVAAWGAGGDDSDSTPTAPANVVKNGNDSGDDSLRDVLANAANGDVITFAPGVTTVLLTEEISFSQENITIDGGGNVTLTEDESDSFRLLNSTASEGTLTLKGLTVENGEKTYDNGGGVYVTGDVALEDCIFQNNSAYEGGGVYVKKSASLIRCTFTDNTSRRNSSGVYAGSNITMAGCTFTDNADGCVSAAGNADSANCTFSNNAKGCVSATGDSEFTDCTFTGSGGTAVSSRNTTLTGCTFTNNNGLTGASVYSRAGATLTDCTFIGNTSQYNGAGVFADGTAALTRCVFVGNDASGSMGGGVYAVGAATLTDCTFTDNTATIAGGGVYLRGAANLTRCTFTNNASNIEYGYSAGGGLCVERTATVTRCTFTGNAASSGGGLSASGTYNDVLDVTVVDCVFDGNTAKAGGAASFKGGSGAPRSMMINCTMTSNTALGSQGGAVYSAAELYMLHCTATDNIGGGVYVDIYAGNAKTTYLYNCIVSGNTQPQTDGGGTIDLTYGNLVDGESIPGSSPAVAATYRQVFGLNAFDPDAGTHKVLTNGIAAGTAARIADLSATALGPADQTAALALLAYDQTGALRASSSVTYGAVEASENALDGIAVTTQPAKTHYKLGEALDLTGTVLSLTYSNGTETIDYNEPGVTNDSSGVDMNTSGNPTIDFAFLGVTTPSDLGVNVSVGKYKTTADITAYPPSPQPYGTSVILTVEVSSDASMTPTGTVEFFDKTVSLGTATLSEGSASLDVSGLTAGAHSLTARYGGDDDFNGSTSQAVAYTIIGDSSGTALTIEGGNVVKTYGDPNFILTAKGGPAGAVAWRSNHPELVSMDPSTGEAAIKGATNGTIVIVTATKSDVSASVTVTVNKKPVTVTADDKHKRVGEADPPLTYTASPAPLQGDVLAGSLKYIGSEPGKYDIVEDIPFAADPNYAVTFVKGTMTITSDGQIPWLWIIVLAVLIFCLAAICWFFLRAAKRRKKGEEGPDS